MMPGPDRTDPAALSRWLLGHATSSNDERALLDGYARALIAAGVPLSRFNVSMPTIHPERRGFGLTWRRDGAFSLYEVAHGEAGETEFLRGPISALIAADRDFGRWRLADGDGCDAFSLFAELRGDGTTEYLLHLVGFAPGIAIGGVGIAYATDRPGGFTDAEAALIAGHIPMLGLAAYRLCLSQTMRQLLGAYVGPMTADRVLNGGIRRGQGEVISAAMLLVDLRSFTQLADHEDPLRVVGWLDQHLDALGQGVGPAGGEILKFTGDGFIAVFPVADRDARPCGVCSRALDAVKAGLAANRALEAGRHAAGEPWLAADLVLHYGEVVYGNIGTADRLDFTAIGRAVNEASRIETLCDALQRNVLISDSFAERCSLPLIDLGEHALRGVEVRRRLWTIADG